MKFKFVSGLILISLTGLASPVQPRASDEPVSSPSPRPKRSAKGKVTRDKDAEGTEARDRFQADTVIKSKYEADGEPLEVDPD